MVSARLLLVAFLLLSIASTGRCADIDMSSFGVSQVRSSFPSIRAYLNLRDADGEPVRSVDPAQFHATVGSHDASVSAVQPFEETGEGTAYILLVDVSKSLNEARFSQIRDALSDWADAMTAKDRAALLTFGTTVRVVQDFTADIAALKSRIAGLGPTDQHTQLHRALTDALEMGRRRDAGLPERRAIAVLSDGRDDYEGGKTRQEVMDAIREHRVPIYAIGLCGPPCGRRQKEDLKGLGAFARTSGGAYFRADSRPFTEIYAQMRGLIRGVLSADIECGDCQWDGDRYRLQIAFTTNTRSVADGADVRLLPPPAASQPEAAPAPAPELEVDPEPESALEPEPETEPARSAPRPEPGDSDPAAPPTSAPTWIYAAWGILVLLLFWLWRRIRARRAGHQASAGESTSSSPQVPAPESPGPLADAAGASAGPGVLIRLVPIGTGAASGPFETRLAPAAVIGRTPGACDISIPDDNEISGKHCELIRERGMVFIRDLGSRNGTLVNGAPIVEKQRLQDGDRVLMGRSEFRFTTP